MERGRGVAAKLGRKSNFSGHRVTTIPLLPSNEPRGSRGKIRRIRGPDKPDLETRREGGRERERSATKRRGRNREENRRKKRKGKKLRDKWIEREERKKKMSRATVCPRDVIIAKKEEEDRGVRDEKVARNLQPDPLPSSLNNRIAHSSPCDPLGPIVSTELQFARCGWRALSTLASRPGVLQQRHPRQRTTTAVGRQ